MNNTLQALNQGIPTEAMLRSVFLRQGAGAPASGKSVQVTFQFIQVKKAKRASGSKLVALAQRGNSGETIKVTALFSFNLDVARGIGENLGFTITDDQVIASIGERVEIANYLNSPVINASEVFSGVEVEINLVQSLYQNPYNTNQDVQRNPSTGEPAMFLFTATGDSFPYYQHTEVVEKGTAVDIFMVDHDEAAKEGRALPSFTNNILQQQAREAARQAATVSGVGEYGMYEEEDQHL